MKDIPKAWKPKNGFARKPLPKRGLVFDEKALEEFLNRNELLHLVTANNKNVNGFTLMFGSKLIKLSSNSNLKDRDNSSLQMRCAVIQFAKHMFTFCHLQTVDTNTKKDEDNKDNNLFVN